MQGRDEEDKGLRAKAEELVNQVLRSQEENGPLQGIELMQDSEMKERLVNRAMQLIQIQNNQIKEELDNVTYEDDLTNLESELMEDVANVTEGLIALESKLGQEDDIFSTKQVEEFLTLALESEITNNAATTLINNHELNTAALAASESAIKSVASKPAYKKLPPHMRKQLQARVRRSSLNLSSELTGASSSSLDESLKRVTTRLGALSRSKSQQESAKEKSNEDSEYVLEVNPDLSDMSSDWSLEELDQEQKGDEDSEYVLEVNPDLSDMSSDWSLEELDQEQAEDTNLEELAEEQAAFHLVQEAINQHERHAEREAQNAVIRMNQPELQPEQEKLAYSKSILNQADKLAAEVKADIDNRNFGDLGNQNITQEELQMKIADKLKYNERMMRSAYADKLPKDNSSRSIKEAKAGLKDLKQANTRVYKAKAAVALKNIATNTGDKIDNIVSVIAANDALTSNDTMFKAYDKISSKDSPKLSRSKLRKTKSSAKKRARRQSGSKKGPPTGWLRRGQRSIRRRETVENVNETPKPKTRRKSGN